MSVVGGAEEEGSATSSSTERPSDTIVVRTQQRSEFKSLMKNGGVPQVLDEEW